MVKGVSVMQFEWLYSGAVEHTKHKIWLWRNISYITATLNLRDSFEYKWNVCQNVMGGFDQNIPNNNCVELQIGYTRNQEITEYSRCQQVV